MVSTQVDALDLPIPGLGSYLWHVAEKRHDWSRELMALLGVEAAPSGDAAEDFIAAMRVHPDDRVRVGAEISAFLESGEACAHTFRIVRPDGSVRRVRNLGAIERDRRGRVLRLRGVLVDFASCDESETRADTREADALRRSERRLRLAQEVGGVASWEFDIDTGEVAWSASARRLFGVGAAWQPSYAGFLALVHPEDRERVCAAVDGAIADDRPLDHRFRIVTPPGIRWLESRARIVRDEVSGRACLMGVDIDVTALVETEQALRAREAELEALKEAAGLAELEVDLLHDQEGSYSPAYRAMHGLAPDVVEHRADWLRRVHPHDRERVAASVEAALAGDGSVLEDEYRIVLPDGKLRWLQSLMRIERDGGGRAVRLSGAQRDVSAEHARADAQREAQERLRAILDTMPAAVWSAGPDGTRDYFNQCWYDTTGLCKSAGADGWAGALHPDDSDCVAAALADSLAAGTPFEAEARIRHADGSYRWHLCRARAVRGADGAVERWYGTCSDIDAHRQLEDRLRLGEARLQLALDASNAVGTWDWDLVTDVFEVDARFVRLYGLPAELAGSSAPKSVFLDAIDPADRARSEKEVVEALERGGAFATTYRVARADGQTRWIASRGLCLKDEGGRPLRLVGVVIDITEMKAAEEARDILARELAHRLKNVFGLLGAIVSMSARGRGAGMEAYASDLRGRFRSLSTALVYAQPGISQLARDRRAVTVLALARELLAPFDPGEPPRIAITGPDAPLSDDETTALALLLHELATNAVKYGALSSVAGHIALHGRVEAGEYVLSWTEAGGPAVRGPPERSGFGLQVVERTVTTQLKGSVALDWRPEGLVATLRLPKAALAPGEGAEPEQA